jgi:pimeloyl-ACP methyl ester carboxylesterase
VHVPPQAPRHPTTLTKDTMSTPLTSYRNDGLTFDVHDWGPANGRPLIALHGFPQTASCWQPVAARLTKAGVRVLAPDQRGYSPGARPQQVDAYRSDRLAGDVLALADAAGWDRFDLVGHDWGGFVAWYLASRHADRISTVTVVSTPHPAAFARALRGPQALRSWYMAAFQIPWLPETLFGIRGGVVARWMFSRSGAQNPREMGKLLSDRATATGTVNWYRAMRQSGAPRAGRVDVPSLYVWSTGDVALGREAAERTRDYVTGDYTFLVLDGASHWVPEERPDELAQAILRHIDR